MKRHNWMLSPIVVVGLIFSPTGCGSRDQDAPSPVVRVDEPAVDQVDPPAPQVAEPAEPAATAQARPEPVKPVESELQRKMQSGRIRAPLVISCMLQHVCRAVCKEKHLSPAVHFCGH